MATTTFRSREEYKRQKELEEARKAGRAAPALDEDGKDINPHIPQYIADAPWYVTRPGSGVSLKHQRDTRPPAPVSSLDTWHVRGVAAPAAAGAAGPAAALAGPTRRPAGALRKGACENCGSLTHKRRECLERPRARRLDALPPAGPSASGGGVGAGAGVAVPVPRDDVLVTAKLGFEAKRDRWSGYDPSEYNRVIERHAKIDAERRRLRMEAAAAAAAAKAAAAAAGGDAAAAGEKGTAIGEGGGGAGADSDSDDDLARLPVLPRRRHRGGSNGSDEEGGEEEAENADKGFRQSDAGEVIMQTKDSGGTRATIRNLRIREDTAKYLRNLDVNSAYYDPKTRAMRADPTPDVSALDKDFAGDNFVRFSGDVQRLGGLELHALKASAAGRDLPHLQADPSLAERAYRDYEAAAAALHEKKQAVIAARYGVQTEADVAVSLGGAAADAVPPAADLVASDEVAVPAVPGTSSAAPVGDDAAVDPLGGDGAPVEASGDLVVGEAAAGLDRVVGPPPAAPPSSSRPLDAHGVPSSIYGDDVLEGNHTSVWGSGYIAATHTWTYACCGQSIRRSVCLGAAGAAAAAAADADLTHRIAVANRKRAAAAAGLTGADGGNDSDSNGNDNGDGNDGDDAGRAARKRARKEAKKEAKREAKREAKGAAKRAAAAGEAPVGA